MSHLALARKWRPQRFDDVIGQRGVVETLKNAISTGRLAQSFIFAGPRGVGKTTTARILARALNCEKGPTAEPCGECDACVEIAQGRDVDVLEIDGATYTGVDAVREVIVEPLAISPMRDRFKIFIIDEVHRLSKSAFDALLKSVEEPPPYVKFMMATTDPQNVPDTIKSRSQVFELRTLPSTLIRDQIRAVTAREHVTIDDAALALIARSAEGSMRDALSALDQILAFTSDRITAADVSTVLGLIGRDLQLEIVETIAREDVGHAFTLAERVVESGFDLRIVLRELARLMRDVMVINIDPARVSDPEIAGEGERERLQAIAAQFSREDVMRAFDLLSKAEQDLKLSSHPRHLFEMALVKWIHLRKLTPLSELIAPLDAGTRPSALGTRPAAVQATGPGPKAVPAPPAPSPEPRAKPQADTSRPVAMGHGPGSAPVGGADLKAALLATIRDQNKTFYNVVIATAQKIEVQGDAVIFTFLPAHKVPRAQLETKKAWIEQLAHSASGRKIVVKSVEAAVAPAPAADPAVDATKKSATDLRERAKAEPAVQDMLDVFGGEIEDVEEIR
jgi:DNA polymerase-3 subunit gamma/tau